MASDAAQPPLIVYVDVDDTLVRTAGAKRIPMAEVVRHVRALFEEGAELYCWSSGGGDYARSVAEELGIARCFRAFLPKPQVMLDDQSFAEWRRLVCVHPMLCGGSGGGSVASYRSALTNGIRTL
jgi:hypothetical protein